jgi:uncharacterized protein YdeI (YjbR/CyaY-like superfamily)
MPRDSAAARFDAGPSAVSRDESLGKRPFWVHDLPAVPWSRVRQVLPQIPEHQSMNRTNPKVDVYLGEAKKWREEMAKLRTILLGCGLSEELKWGKPCYTFQDGNVAMLYGLKESCALGFFKGALLKDAEGILIKPGENSQSARWIKFTSVGEIAKMKTILKGYIDGAIEVERAGLEVDFQKNAELVYPEEFQRKLDEMPALKAAFEALTPGRRRGYNLHFSAPKQSKTRESRVESCMQRILHGKGFNDCICGRSKNQPRCDGSHKSIR